MAEYKQSNGETASWRLNEKTRRSGTAAGFVPKPCQTLATKSAERHLRNALNSLLDLYSPPRNEKTRGSGAAAGFVLKPC